MTHPKPRARRLERLSQDQLDRILKRHVRFRKGRLGGARAVLSFFDLGWLNFREADLTDADLTGADLDGAKLHKTTMPDGSINKP